jgi:hypothetical protein
MERSMKRFLAAIVAASPLALFAGDSMAGLSYTQQDYCYKGSDGSGLCYGTLRDFRVDADPSAYASFSAPSCFFFCSGPTFSAYVKNTYYMCKFPSVTAPLPTFSLKDAVMTRDALFLIRWDAQGNCSELELSNSSQYGAFDP